MRAFGTGVALLAGLASACAATANEGDIERYSVIWARQPFGRPAPAPVSPPAAVAPQQNPAVVFGSLRLCYIGWDEDNGVTCAIIDNKTSVPSFLRVGESLDDGTLLAEADYEQGSALLRKGSAELRLYVGGTPPPAASTAAAFSAVPATLSLSAPPGPPGLAARRRDAASKAVRQRTVQPPMYQGEELEKHLQGVQMDIIRSHVLEGGEKGPPLPIPLSPESDDQLVREGVLPPVQ